MTSSQQPTSPGTRLVDHLVTPGIILLTERFDACVAFYRDTLGLPVWFEKPGLVCLRFGGGYLMIEQEGVAAPGRKSVQQNPTILRFNVADVRAMAAMMTAAGIDVTVKDYDWGTIGTFIDPDGNTCGLKNADDPFFDLD
ncbi:VOC family protein [Loktanella sp. M215]|uniref:VOC family protein n=1 Tax=Loktanella sp. M215 TaxID=2675431 RepID=UPI001F327750|nr:VOC family protein [Loktanella sp. M215]MCF7699339.1 glyoxalase/bleomycin resistance/dioxygenase family protein [Loktanella sp. M215]